MGERPTLRWALGGDEPLCCQRKREEKPRLFGVKPHFGVSRRKTVYLFQPKIGFRGFTGKKQRLLGAPKKVRIYYKSRGETNFDVSRRKTHSVFRLKTRNTVFPRRNRPSYGGRISALVHHFFAHDFWLFGAPPTQRPPAPQHYAPSTAHASQRTLARYPLPCVRPTPPRFSRDNGSCDFFVTLLGLSPRTEQWLP